MPLHLPQVSEPAPDFIVSDLDGEHVWLAELAKPVVLVFLRHLG
jgi:peroxiredoxin